MINAVSARLQRRYERLVEAGRTPDVDGPVFATDTGSWISPANIRTRLRRAIAKHPDLVGTTPHTLRRTVATEIFNGMGMEAARLQMGHADGSMTSQVYVAGQNLGPDARKILNEFFQPIGTAIKHRRVDGARVALIGVRATDQLAEQGQRVREMAAGEPRRSLASTASP